MFEQRHCDRNRWLKTTRREPLNNPSGRLHPPYARVNAGVVSQGRAGTHADPPASLETFGWIGSWWSCAVEVEELYLWTESVFGRNMWEELRS